MDEKLGLGRKIVIDNVVQERDVDTAGRHVRRDHHGNLLRLELGRVNSW